MVDLFLDFNIWIKQKFINLGKSLKCLCAIDFLNTYNRYACIRFIIVRNDKVHKVYGVYGIYIILVYTFTGKMFIK